MIARSTVNASLSLITVLVLSISAAAWHHSTGCPAIASRTTNARLRAVSHENAYVVARGDGSTGGGGLPMPEYEDGPRQKRPKVGAEMPHGRPSWFKVPAPSQG